MAGTGFAETTPYGNLECGRAKSGRRDLMGSQRVARPSLERGMEAASGQKRTPQHEGVTEGRGGNGRKPPPPHTMPEMHPRPFFGGFWHPQWSFARVLPHPQGHPQASARALADMWIKMAGFPDLALRRCCLG